MNNFSITAFIFLGVFTLSFLQFLAPVEADDSVCSKYSNGTCQDCVKNDGYGETSIPQYCPKWIETSQGIKYQLRKLVRKCYYCVPTKKCASGVVKATLHASCKDNQWKVGQCVFTGKILLIVLPTLGGVILIALCCCIYCCCCRKKKRGSKKEDKQEAKWRRQREDIKIKHSERRAERQQKYDEIRKKYGLNRKNGDEGDGKYHQFTNEV
ncbi:pituitary tumor-transforming gene 1 protein-interacting protein isoform X1 [Nematostella vectensis]|uniref:pituitary tumor-transforming gene 1 protein-interacting protein isoform X1 n=1 Tax=Nematostella vectensis TaxID=45351 RepID=UPI00207758C0|nr:pituitary tumor-transforming gene 1 protein-interacting protein isoform X1 [Nematostella vectensis]